MTQLAKIVEFYIVFKTILIDYLTSLIVKIMHNSQHTLKYLNIKHTHTHTHTHTYIYMILLDYQVYMFQNIPIPKHPKKFENITRYN